ncbi:Uma2 family endonuclease [Sphingomonas sp.]|jgi:Uma2 family endonuclease|uniref:Uma2 family endonuclease n=1 Tax=Sphingomonas sp. TaxID=28214 RepID=UPI002E119517|nr:Uma2 family endonuclease [Sphingomonas sp.]
MRRDPAYRPITADEFLEMDFGTDKKFELHDGVIYMMTGGTQAHSWVQGNVLTWLRQKLRGSSCRPYGPDMALKVTDTDVRYPDVTVYCGQSPDPFTGETTLENPTVVIEVLSPSTTTFDQGTKLEEYRAMPSVSTIAFIDPANQLCRSVERQTDGWLDQPFSATRGIPLPSLDLTIPHDEIFARD